MTGWSPEPATLREGESPDRDAHARRNLEQIRRAVDDGVIDLTDLSEERRDELLVTDGGEDTVWVATGRNGSPTTRYHTDPECRYIKQAPNPKERRAEWYREHYEECSLCKNGGEPSNGGGNLDHYNALTEAAESGDHGLLTENGDADVSRQGGSA